MLQKVQSLCVMDLCNYLQYWNIHLTWHVIVDCSRCYALLTGGVTPPPPPMQFNLHYTPP